MNDHTPPTRGLNNGLSITSLVLGLCSFFCLILTAIPAVITGHIALSRISKSPGVYGGRTMAIVGLVLGYICIALSFVAIPAALLLPALANAKSKALSVRCVNHMKQIGLAARIWALDHEEKLPPDFLTMSNELGTTSILICPSDSTKTMATDWSRLSESRNVSYEYLTPSAEESKVLAEVVFRCPIHHHTGLGDGSVQQVRRLPRRN